MTGSINTELQRQRCQQIAEILAPLDGVIPGFPDSEARFHNLVVAIEKFVSLVPTRHFNVGTWSKGDIDDCPHDEAEMSRLSVCPACKAVKVCANPMQWLAEELENRCSFWPSLREIRMAYCKFFPARDGRDPSLTDEIGGRRGRQAVED